VPPPLADFTPPTKQEIIKLFDDNGYNEKSASRAYETFDSYGWPSDWEEKMKHKYFRDENKQR
jgi:hypothetical protein